MRLATVGAILVLVGTVLTCLDYVIGPERLQRLEEALKKRSARALSRSPPSARELLRRFWARESHPLRGILVTTLLAITIFGLLRLRLGASFELKGNSVALDHYFFINLLINLLLIILPIWVVPRFGVFFAAFLMAAHGLGFLRWYYDLPLPSRPRLVIPGTALFIDLWPAVFALLMCFGAALGLATTRVAASITAVSLRASQRLIHLLHAAPKGVLGTVGFILLIIGSVLQFFS